MYATKDFGRLTVGFDTRKHWPPDGRAGSPWWPPFWVGPYAVWFVPVPWVFVCWQRDR